MVAVNQPVKLSNPAWSCEKERFIPIIFHRWSPL